MEGDFNLRVVLASCSPRRRELLRLLGLEFEVIPDREPEIIVPGLTPGETVCLG